MSVDALGTPLGNNIRRFRFEHGEMTQDALARRAGITRQTIVALEGCRYGPSLELAMRIADIFERRVDEVFFWRNHAPPPKS